MSVYKEGFMIVGILERTAMNIFPDAADHGTPTKKDDRYWNMAKQLVDFYGVEGTRKVDQYGTGHTVSQDIELMDEWDTGDRYTYNLMYVSCNSGACKGMDGFFSIIKKKTKKGNLNLDY